MHFKVSEIQAGDLSHAVFSDRVEPKYHRGRMFNGVKHDILSALSKTFPRHLLTALFAFANSRYPVSMLAMIYNPHH
jgi:hypothetical protein